MVLRFVLRVFLLFAVSIQSYALDLFSDPKFLPAEQAFPVTTEIADGKLKVNFASVDGYYLYKHRLYLTQNEQTYWPVEYSQVGLKKEDESFGQVDVFYQNLDVSFDLSMLGSTTATLHYQGCADAGLCYPPQTKVIDIPVQAASELADKESSEAFESNTEVASSPKSEHESDVADVNAPSAWFANKSIWHTLALFFLAGIALTFTPCVLPMVPILTSVVLGQQKRSAKQGFMLSSLYVLGMAITFAIAGLSVGLLGAGANLQAWMQTPWVLVVFALMFLALALSMFGLYELSLPNSLTQKLDRLSRKQKSGQGLGVFIMGVLSALVVSPCVSAPLAGALIYLSTTGDAFLGGFALLALGLGMGAPLIVLGTTGASILPKAGAWMEQIKVLFGVVLIGVAIWLLTRILPASFALLLWAVLAIVYAVYLGALESAASMSGRLVKAVALLLLIYGIAAFVGFLQGASDPLRPLNQVLGSHTASISSDKVKSNKTDSKEFEIISDAGKLDDVISQSTVPVMVDIYADWCISCKEMEKHIFSQSNTQNALADYKWIKFDITQQTDGQIDWLRNKGLFGPPSILFFNNGQEIADSRMVGEQSLEAFLQAIPSLQ